MLTISRDAKTEDEYDQRTSTIYTMQDKKVKKVGYLF